VNLAGELPPLLALAVDEPRAAQRRAVGVVEHEPVALVVGRPLVGVARRHDRPVELRAHAIGTIKSKSRASSLHFSPPWPASTYLDRDASLARAGEDGGVHEERVPGGGEHDAVAVLRARGVPRRLDGVGVVRHAVPDGAEVLHDVVHGDRAARRWLRRRVGRRAGGRIVAAGPRRRRRRRGRRRGAPRVRRRVPPRARRARSLGGRVRVRGVVPGVLGVAVVAALGAAAEAP
jgi:hypothetical protein